MALRNLCARGLGTGSTARGGGRQGSVRRGPVRKVRLSYPSWGRVSISQKIASTARKAGKPQANQIR